jgi:catechol 2,3-dioxygenase-like lactoylglutathione lyase family enzyme
MTGIRALHHTGYTVDDLERSLGFYRDLLGMQEVARQEKQGGYLAEIVGYPDAHVRMAHLRVRGGEHMLELFEYVAPAGRAASDALAPVDTGTPHLCFAVDDLQGLYERLLDAGVDTFVSAPVEVDTGVNQGALALYLRDPDGVPVELFQPAAR